MHGRGEEDRLDSLRRAKREPSDPNARANADRIEERLELGDPGLLLFPVLVERRPKELEAIRPERPEERALRDLGVRDRAEEEEDVHREGHDDVPDAQAGENPGTDQAEDRRGG